MKYQKNLKMETIKWIQNWYHDQCNGDWEHSFGLEITTIDNPGWLVKIDLTDTTLEGISLAYTLVENSEDDWYGYKIENGVFESAGDPRKLDVLLEKFRQLVEGR